MNFAGIRAVCRRAGFIGLTLWLATPLAWGQAATIADFDTIELTAPERGTAATVAVTAFDQTFLLELTDNPGLFASLGDDQRRQLEFDRNRFLRGEITGVAGSWVRLSRVAGTWSGGFFDGTELYLVDRAGDLAAALPRAPARADDTLVYRFSDLRLPGISHEPIRLPGRERNTPDAGYRAFVDHLRVLNERAGTMMQMPVTLVTDTQFNGTHGGNTAAVAAARINFIDGIYSEQVGVSIGLHHLEILSSNGPLTSTSAETLLVDQFRPYMTTGGGSSIPFAGLAHLFTGRDLNGSTVGIAYLDVLCNSGFGYGVDQNLSSSTNSALVFAHEVGHNFGAPHDGEGECSDEPFRGIMNPSINGSQEFSDCSIQQMAGPIASASCMEEVPVEDDLVFADGFQA